jgi:hypothetical protein
VIDTIAIVLRRLVVPLARLADAPAQALRQLSDDADEVWEPFLTDPAPRAQPAARGLVT